MDDPIQLKEKIVSIFKAKGPSIPVRIAKEINLSPLFTSAFLSELLSEKTIKTSHMRMGGTPIYLLPGQEPQLEPFAEQHLKSKEKDAFLMLRKRNFLKDSKQDPAIRVALRAIRDFAIPFKKDDEIYWRYLTVPEDDFEKEPKKKKEEKKEEIKEEVEEIITSTPTGGQGGTSKELEEELPKKEELNIFEEEPTPKDVPQNISSRYLQEAKKKPKKTSVKKHDKFFNIVKESLTQKQIEILDIQDFNKNEITLLVKENGNEKLLIAYNKKRINEADIIKANQRASKLNLKYILISKGEPLKKTLNLVEAAKNLSKIEKIE